MATSKQNLNKKAAWQDNWPNVRKKLKSQYPELTEEDLKYQTGSENELYKKIGYRIGKNREETEDLFNKTYESTLDMRDVGAPSPKKAAKRAREANSG